MANDPVDRDDAVAEAHSDAPEIRTEAPREELVVEQQILGYPQEEGATPKAPPRHGGGPLARAWSVDGAAWRGLAEPGMAGTRPLRRRALRRPGRRLRPRRTP